MSHPVARWFVRLALLASLLAAFLVGSTAAAQTTGGSFGGSSWGSSGGSSSSGSSSGGSSSSGSSDPSSSGGGHSTYGGPMKESRPMILWVMLDSLLVTAALLTFALCLSAFGAHAERTGARSAPSSARLAGYFFAFMALVVALSVVAFLHPDTGAFGAARPLRLAPGVEVEVRVEDRWCNGMVLRPEAGGRWRVRARTWTATYDQMVVPPSALQARFGALWRDVRGWKLPHVAMALDLALIVAAIALGRKWKGPRGVSAPVGVRVATLSLAFDASVRRDLQARLETFATRARLGSSTELRGALGDVLRELAQRSEGMRAAYGAAVELGGPEEAQRDFEARVTIERGRYMVERVRADAAGVRSVETKSAARAEEGGGFVVVTVLAAWEGGVFLAPVASRDELTALAVRVRASEATVRALEVVWVPADPADVMSSAEMGEVFPQLAWIDEESRQRFGRAVCASCGAAYARELGRCPACGAAPATAR
jgi:hypothetical protein